MEGSAFSRFVELGGQDCPPYGLLPFIVIRLNKLGFFGRKLSEKIPEAIRYNRHIGVLLSDNIMVTQGIFQEMPMLPMTEENIWYGPINDGARKIRTGALAKRM